MQAALALRTEVFVGEQGVAPDEEIDGRDDEALHLLACDDDELVGTCRLLFGDDGRAKLGRMAVRRDAAGAGEVRGALLLETGRLTPTRAALEALGRRGPRSCSATTAAGRGRFTVAAGYERQADVASPPSRRGSSTSAGGWMLVLRSRRSVLRLGVH